MLTKEYLKDLISRKNELYKFLEIASKEEEKNKLEEASQTSDFWEDPKKAQITLKQLGSLKSWLRAYSLVVNNLDELDILLELNAAESEINTQLQKAITAIEELEFKNMLSSKEDNLSAVMMITPGAGGTESQDWAEMIMRMYVMWGEKTTIR